MKVGGKRKLVVPAKMGSVDWLSVTNELYVRCYQLHYVPVEHEGKTFSIPQQPKLKMERTAHTTAGLASWSVIFSLHLLLSCVLCETGTNCSYHSWHIPTKSTLDVVFHQPPSSYCANLVSWHHLAWNVIVFNMSKQSRFTGLDNHPDWFQSQQYSAFLFLSV